MGNSYAGIMNVGGTLPRKGGAHDKSAVSGGQARGGHAANLQEVGFQLFAQVLELRPILVWPCLVFGINAFFCTAQLCSKMAPVWLN